MMQFGQIDAAILRTDSFDLSKYEYVTYLEEELVLIYPDKMEHLDKEYVTLEEIADHPLISFDESSTQPSSSYFTKETCILDFLIFISIMNRSCPW